MKFLVSALLLPLLAHALPNAHKPKVPAPDADGKYTIKSTGITAKFIPYTAAITNLWVADRNGVQRDIVLGYDNASYYETDPNHPDYGAVPGRYVNRIGNHTYVMDGVRYITEANDGNNTLHSGTAGWNHRIWNVTEVTDTSITFSLRDEGNSSQGFPGLVLVRVKYTVSPNAWTTEIEAAAPEHKTPLMSTQHAYWNLDSFANPDTDLVLNHTLYLPYGTQTLSIDGTAVPDGKIIDVPAGSVNDFWSKPKQIGASSLDPAYVGNCGSTVGCNGYNQQILVKRNETDMDHPIATLSSDFTGIKWDLYSDQVGTVLYSCWWMGGANPLKSTQGGPKSNGFVQSQGCVCVEPHDYVDGINHPEWGRIAEQITGPDSKPYKNTMTYRFSTIK